MISVNTELTERQARRIERRRAIMEQHPVLVSDWRRALFVHFAVEPKALQPFVPFALDVRGGQAFVSLVAFIMERLRPTFGGRVLAACAAPVARHELLNVRTYVRHRGIDGIYFIREWIPNRLSALLGPPTYGLPYRLGTLRYEHDHDHGTLSGVVRPRTGGRLAYRATFAAGARFEPCPPGSLSEFLMEHYTAFTCWRGVRRAFRIRHEPWPQTPVRVQLVDDSVLDACSAWYRGARLVGANYSPGLRDVAMGRPRFVK